MWVNGAIVMYSFSIVCSKHRDSVTNGIWRICGKNMWFQIKKDNKSQHKGCHELFVAASVAQSLLELMWLNCCLFQHNGPLNTQEPSWVVYRTFSETLPCTFIMCLVFQLKDRWHRKQVFSVEREKLYWCFSYKSQPLHLIIQFSKIQRFLTLRQRASEEKVVL